VVVADIDDRAGTAEAETIGGSYVHMDVADATSISEALNELPSPVDILVNNAGIGLAPTPLTDVSPEDFDRLLAVNVRSIYNTTRLIVPGMRAGGGGAILNIASTAGVSPRPGLTWYNASKGWVITATRSMAVELAPDNIRVNAINPVAGETPLLSTFMGGDTEENRARFLATIPLGRFSTPDDIASAACFLCSDEASMITGVALEVDGGRCV
jgi:3-oxoacyl-[acyl-carrier protein] reductase